jgi:hypothetical protein
MLLGHTLDDPLALQLAKAIREHLGRDSTNVNLKLGKAARAFAQVPDHMCRPGAPKHTHAMTERTFERRWQNLAFASFDHIDRLTKW